MKISTRFPTLSRSVGLLWLAALATATAAEGPTPVRDSRIAAANKTGLRIAMGVVDLPRNGQWWIENLYGELGGVTEVYLTPVEEDEPDYEGERMAKLMDRREHHERRSAISQVYWACQDYARTHEGMAPGKLDELDLIKKPEPGAPREQFNGIHLVPGVRLFEEVGDNPRMTVEAVPFLIDTAPAVADGKHWIFNSHGQAIQEEIDAARMKEMGLAITARQPSHLDAANDGRTTTPHHIFARLTRDPAAVTLTARDSAAGKTLPLAWDLPHAAPGDEEVCTGWAELRAWGLDGYARSEAPLASTWVQRIVEQYGCADYPGFRGDLFGDDGAERTTNAMGVLGGRAAIQETLQMQRLQAAAEDAESWNPKIPIAEIPGVVIEPHPFEKMLDGQPGGRLALADWIPHDHFMLYLQKPDAIFPLLDGGVDFMGSSGSMLTGRSMSYHLKDRYLGAFGFSENLMRRFLETGAIEELAVSIPDLFLIDGTEMSVVMRTGKPLLTTVALAMIGIPPGDGTTVKKNERGDEVYWARRGDILIASSNHAELQAILDAKDKGTCLGASAEFRYMLTQVPVTPETAAYAYFSDPFIRRLVSPATKIGQLRRLLARRELEEATAGSLLARFDGQGAESTKIPFLQKHGYMGKPFYAGDLVLDPDSVARSGFYGTAANLKSLTDLPVELASDQEKKAYEAYLEGYNSFWRRFYDPIAVRYEQHGEGQHQLETFILPLIDNSIYGGIREVLTPEARQVPIRVPVIEPTPVAILSLSLNEDTWLEGIEGLAEGMEQYLGLDPSILDLLGPDLHLAIQDADPIIALGSGELAGLFGSFGNDSDMMAIPLFVSMLTRPCTVHIGLQDPALVKKKLAAMSWAGGAGQDSMMQDFGEGSLYQVTGQQKWIYRWSIEGVITIRLGIEVQDRYLVINNLPFSNHVKVTGNKPATRGAASLELNPSAALVQLPVLFASAAEQLRLNTHSGMACLAPLMLSGTADPAAAQAAHAKFFGFEPVHPLGGTWTWDAKEVEMTSSVFGSTWKQTQPAFDPKGTAAGILNKVSHLDLGMQFEEDGLRSTVRWTVK